MSWVSSPLSLTSAVGLSNAMPPAQVGPICVVPRHATACSCSRATCRWYYPILAEWYDTYLALRSRSLEPPVNSSRVLARRAGRLGYITSLSCTLVRRMRAHRVSMSLIATSSLPARKCRGPFGRRASLERLLLALPGPSGCPIGVTTDINREPRTDLCGWCWSTSRFRSSSSKYLGDDSSSV